MQTNRTAVPAKEMKTPRLFVGRECETPLCFCPKCGHEMDHASGIGHNHKSSLNHNEP